MYPYRRPSPEAVMASFRRPQPAAGGPVEPGDTVIVTLADGEVTGVLLSLESRAAPMARVRFTSGLWAGSTGAVMLAKVRKA